MCVDNMNINAPKNPRGGCVNITTRISAYAEVHTRVACDGVRMSTYVCRILGIICDIIIIMGYIVCVCVCGTIVV